MWTLLPGESIPLTCIPGKSISSIDPPPPVGVITAPAASKEPPLLATNSAPWIKFSTVLSSYTNESVASATKVYVLSTKISCSISKVSVIRKPKPFASELVFVSVFVKSTTVAGDCTPWKETDVTFAAGGFEA